MINRLLGIEIKGAQSRNYVDVINKQDNRKKSITLLFYRNICGFEKCLGYFVIFKFPTRS